MNTYYCKCGRTVQKSTAAENTGNRDVKGCDGCPYLMPWGTDKYIEGHGFVKDVQGYECRMSRDLDYATRFGGSVQDKCSCYIASLDFEFLERVSNWIAENYPTGEIFGCFCRADIRPTDYVSNGRYRMSIGCAQNKKGIAAKAALLERFFYPDGSRKDLTPEKERALIMSRIAAGKEFAHKKEDKLESRQYKNEYGTVFAVREKDGEPRLMCLSEDGLGISRWAVSGVLAARTGDAKTEEELQAVLDRTAEELGWTECKDTDAPTGAAAVTTGGNAASAESTAETSTTSESGEDASTSTSATSSQTAETSTLAPGSPAATAPAAPSPSGAESASLGAAFDYSGLDAQTVQDLHLAEREFAGGKRMAEIGLRRMADGVAIAHDALCVTIATKCRNGKGAFSDSEKTFGRWCESIGLNRKAAERLLQVSNLFDSSTPREQKVLEELGPSLLYAAAKPSAPAELVQAVKDGDITTHKQYQELLSRYNAERDAREQAEQERDEVATHIQAARDMQIDTARERDAALRRAVQAEAERNAARQEASAASARAESAENRALGFEKIAEQRADIIAEQKRQISELESRPRDVAIAQPSEEDAERYRKEGEARMMDAARKLANGKAAEVARLTNALAQAQDQLASARPDADACQRMVDAAADAVDTFCVALRASLRAAQLDSDTYDQTTRRVRTAAHSLLNTISACAPEGWAEEEEELF